MANIQDKKQENRLEPAESAEGFMFFSRKDAQLAAIERKKVDYLEARMDYSKPDIVLNIYKKTIEERIFKTPVGIVYLKRLQDYLLERSEIPNDEIPPIVLYQNYNSEVRTRTNPTRNRVKPAVKEEKKGATLPISIVLNILLVIAILSMFIISINADQPNILNYERTLVDKYSAWDQELSQREQAVREKELEMHIQE